MVIKWWWRDRRRLSPWQTVKGCSQYLGTRVCYLPHLHIRLCWNHKKTTTAGAWWHSEVSDYISCRRGETETTDQELFRCWRQGRACCNGTCSFWLQLRWPGGCLLYQDFLAMVKDAEGFPSSSRLSPLSDMFLEMPVKELWFLVSIMILRHQLRGS